VTSEFVIAQLDSLLKNYRRRTSAHQQFGTMWEPKDITALTTRARGAIERLAPPNTVYLATLREVTGEESSDVYRLERLIGIVEALREDYKAGALLPIQDLIRAEVFDDFLDMAEHLLGKEYKDPAAVLIGGVLEDQLRKLALRTGLPVETPDGRMQKADTLNARLTREGIYNKLDQKSITSWLDLRNKAAHGDYEVTLTSRSILCSKAYETSLPA